MEQQQVVAESDSTRLAMAEWKIAELTRSLGRVLRLLDARKPGRSPLLLLFLLLLLFCAIDASAVEQHP